MVSAERRRRRRGRGDLRRGLGRSDRRRASDARQQRLRPHLPDHAEGPQADDAGARPATTAGQVQALLSPAVNVRSSGFEGLKANRAAALPAVQKILADPNPYHRARAVWLMAHLGPDGVKEVEGRLADPDAQLRIAAFRALRQVKTSMIAEARRLATDPSPAVRREVALALRGVPFHESRDILLTLAAGYDGRDRGISKRLARPRPAPRRRSIRRCSRLAAILIRLPGTSDSRPSPGACTPRPRSRPLQHGQHHSTSALMPDDRHWWRSASSTTRARRRPWPILRAAIFPMSPARRDGG